MSPPSVSDEDSVRTLRRQVDTIFMERMVRVETTVHDLEKRFDKDFTDITHKLEEQKGVLDQLQDSTRQLVDRQKKSDPILEGLDSLSKASAVMRWIIIVAMGLMGAIATVLSIIDYFKKGV